MQYQIGQYILDSRERVLLKESDGSLVSDNDRIVEVLLVLAKEYPALVSRSRLLETIWPTKDVTDWALSRLIADIRRLFEEIGEKEQILKTVHGKGFRLTVPVMALGDDGQVQPGNPSSRIKHTRTVFGVGLAFVLVILSMFGMLRYHREMVRENAIASDREGRIALKGQRWDKTKEMEVLPFSEGWSTNEGLAIDFHDGVSFSPIASVQRIGYEYFGPVNLNNAIVSYDMSVSQEYIDSGADVQPYALLLFGNWRGEWNCIIENYELSTQRNTYQCKLDEPGAIFNIGKGESMRIGVQALSKGEVAGTITLHQVKIKRAPSYVEGGWLTSGESAITYDGGVQYSPKDGGERLEFKYNGPDNFQGATIIFTIEASQEYIDSGATILPYAQRPSGTWLGEWGCWVPNSALSPVGSRIECRLDEPDDLFNLKEGDSLLIGIMSQRGERRMKGSIKIKNVEIDFP